MEIADGASANDKASLLELQGIRLFEGIDLSPVYETLERCPIRYLRPQEVLLTPDEGNDTLFLILAGECAVHLQSLDDEPVTVLGPGESVGELSLIDDQPVSAFVVANTSCRLLEVDRRSFWTLADREEGFARNLLVTLANRLRETNRAVRTRGRDYLRSDPDHDPLTGLPTRVWVEDALRRQIDHCRITQRDFSVLVIEIADFDGLVDNYGDLAGEEFVRAIGEVLKTVLRPTDRPARYSGGGFVVLLPNTEEEFARIAAERVRAAVHETVLTLPDDSILPSISVDFGAAGFTPESTVESLIDSARGDLARRRARMGKRYI
jgi:diguanylate cyclase